jgi:glucose-6-phosphate isomerase
MPEQRPDITRSQPWLALEQHQKDLQGTPMRALFEADSERFPHFLLKAAGLTLDYSKNRITRNTLDKLMALARHCALPERIAAMFRGDDINRTEARPALHVALRNTDPGASLNVNGKDILPEIRHTLDRMEAFVAAIYNGKHTGFSGQAFTDVVSIGIGGSYLGPKLVTEALTPFRDGLCSHFVANIDGSDVSEVLRRVKPDTTLFLIQSKSFGTQETLANARVARDWFLANGGNESAIADHFVAVTTNREAATDFGLNEKNLFPMWDWVGGRYSLWSAIGLPIALSVGMDNFRALLAGAHELDEHFRTAPLEQNLPVVMAMLGIWYNNFWNAESHAILPYDHYLASLPDHLQQLDMESNGKRVTEDGQAVTYPTGPIIWGGVGANGQHAYHQLIHQGTRLIPCDFIIPLRSHNPVDNHHATLFANCLSQSQAMMRGKTLEEARQELADEGKSRQEIEDLAPHKVIPGNQPNNLLLMDQLNPRTLGALIALYEHRTFVQGVIWGLDSFDQWGVELGKQLGKGILRQLEDGQPAQSGDSSTDGLINLFRQAAQSD